MLGYVFYIYYVFLNKINLVFFVFWLKFLSMRFYILINRYLRRYYVKYLFIDVRIINKYMWMNLCVGKELDNYSLLKVLVMFLIFRGCLVF